jgi:hypothetical protein
MNNQYKKKSSYSSFKKDENNLNLYSIPDSLVFNGASGKEHYYIKDENGDFHQLNHLFIEDPNRKRKLGKGYYIKARSEGLFDNCPFLIEKNKREITKDNLEYFLKKPKKIIIE